MYLIGNKSRIHIQRTELTVGLSLGFTCQWPSTPLQQKRTRCPLFDIRISVSREAESTRYPYILLVVLGFSRTEFETLVPHDSHPIAWEERILPKYRY